MKRLLPISLLTLLLISPRLWGVELVVIQSISPGASISDHMQYRWDNTQDPKMLPDNDQAWSLSSYPLLFFGYRPKDTLWLRVQLFNRSDKPVKRWLWIDYPPLDEITLFLFGEHSSQIFHSGDRYPAARRPLPTNVHAFPIHIGAGKTVRVFLRVRSQNSFILPIELHTDTSMVVTSVKDSWRDGLLYGVLLVLALFNLFASLLLGERAYLYLTGFVIAFVAYLASVDGYGQLFLWRWWPELQQRTLTSMPNLSTFFALLFIAHVIPTKHKFYRLIFTSAWIAAVIGVISLLLPTYRILTWLYPFAGWFVLLVAWAQISIWRTREPTNRLIAAGWLLVVLGWILDLLEKLGVDFMLGTGDFALLVFGCLGVFLLSIALIERIKTADKMREASRQQTAMIQQQAMAELEEKVKQRTVELEAANKRLRQLNEQLMERTAIDQLTGLHNRAAFDDALNNQWKHASRAQSPLSIIFFDVDHFKRINDRYGHDIGDECLKLVAQTIAQQIVRETDFVARYGGEEFVTLLPHTSSRDAEVVAERIRKAIARLTPVFAGAQLSVTISAGVATTTWQASDESPKKLLKLADLALYKAKQKGRNRVVVAGEDLREQLREIFS